jgi:hydrogenase nickel insertion protein HypA
MHELSVITSVVETIKQEMKKHKNLICVKEIRLEVGELAFLSHDALKFGFRALTEKEKKVNSKGLRIIKVKAKVKCHNCGYKGPMKLEDSKEYHVHVPLFSCPKCGGQIVVIKGKECTIKNLVLDLEDD